MTKGKVVQEIPKKRTTRRVNNQYDWDKHALQARKAWPNPILAEGSVPMSHVNSVRLFKGDPFSNKDGHIEVHLRNSKVDDKGIRRGEVYLQWVPNETKEETDATTSSG